jgi:adenosylhomocysteine nucleosidase
LIAPTQSTRAEPLTAIIGAIDEEIRILRAQVAEPREVTFYGLRFVRGQMGGREVVIGPAGIGKVNSSMTAALLIDRFHPDELIFTGIAGALSPELRPGDIVIGRATVQHDFRVVKSDTSLVMTPPSVTGEALPLYLPADARLLELARAAAAQTVFDSTATAPEGARAPRVHTGVIATGDAFIASSAKKAEIRELLNADVVEMEGAAVAQVCRQLGVSCVVIRSVSDSATEKAGEEIARFAAIAASNSARLVTTMTRLLAEAQDGDR